MWRRSAGSNCMHHELRVMFTVLVSARSLPASCVCFLMLPYGSKPNCLMRLDSCNDRRGVSKTLKMIWSRPFGLDLPFHMDHAMSEVPCSLFVVVFVDYTASSRSSLDRVRDSSNPHWIRCQ